MGTIIGILVIAAIWMSCALVIHSWVGEDDPTVFISAGLLLGAAWLIGWGSLMLPYLGVDGSLTSALVLAVAAGWRAWAQRRPVKWSLWPLCLSLPGMLVAGLFGLFIMSVSQVVEDGFFLHSSNIGMLLAGRCPPVNFAGQPLQGHYGKDLITALLARALDADFLTVEWASTVCLVAVQFPFLAAWWGRLAQNFWVGLWAACLVYFGCHYGSHLGLADTVVNNNAVAFCVLNLTVYLLSSYLERGDRLAAWLATFLLGLDALVYELHFGLLGLALLFTALSLYRKRLSAVSLIGLGALVLAFFVGGPIHHILAKKLSGTDPQASNRGYQAQEVAIRFPKQDLFWLRTDNLRPSRPFETKLRPFEADFQESRGSSPLWSPKILASFWYPVWLAPLIGLVLVLTCWKRPQWAWAPVAVFFWFVGFFSILTPSVVSFGYFENETGRWFFGAAYGFTVAFGLASGGWLVPHLQANQRIWWKVVLAGLALGALAWFCFGTLTTEVSEMRLALANPGAPLKDGSPGIIPSGSLLPDPRASLKHHFGFGPSDWNQFQALHQLSRREPARRFLYNYRPEPTPSKGVELATGGLINLVGLQTGFSGLLPAGLASEPDNEWCAPLYSPSLRARLFWHDPQIWRLQEMQVGWLVIDGQRWQNQEFLRSQALRNRYEVDGRAIYQLDPSKPEASPSEPPSNLRLSGEVQMAPLTMAQVPIQMKSDAQGCRLTLRFRIGEQVVDPAEPLSVEVSTGPGGSGQLLLVAPFFAGDYVVEYRCQGQWLELGQLRCR